MASRNGEQLYVGRVHPLIAGYSADCSCLSVVNWTPSGNLIGVPEAKNRRAEALMRFASPVFVEFDLT
jgi:hypothetical protein